MDIAFIGGPYDGKEIDDQQILEHAQVVRVEGDLGVRTFVLMPEGPAVWDRLVRGEAVRSDRLIPYERFEYLASGAIGGTFLRATTQEVVDRARSEARLKVHSRATTALGALGEGDRRRVIEAVDVLQHQPPEKWSRDKAVRLRADQQVYLLRATPELRAFVRVLEDGQIELNDIVQEGTLQMFREQAASAPQ